MTFVTLTEAGELIVGLCGTWEGGSGWQGWENRVPSTYDTLQRISMRCRRWLLSESRTRRCATEI